MGSVLSGVTSNVYEKSSKSRGKLKLELFLFSLSDEKFSLTIAVSKNLGMLIATLALMMRKRTLAKLEFIFSIFFSLYL